MKYLKMLLIPFIALILMVPVKADETPDWVFTEHYYLVGTHKNSGDITATIFTTKNNIVKSSDSFYVPMSSVIAVYRLVSGSDTWTSVSINHSTNIFDGVTYTHIGGISTRYGYSLNYSNFDLVINGNTVFQKTPVTTHAMVRQKATEKAVETLGMEVQGTSGTISLVGGVILGSLLVVLLISRLRYWVRV